MRVDEMKIRIHRFIFKTIDLYMPCDDVINKLGNATAKLYIEQHLDTIDRILNIFANENGEIDESVVLKSYEDALFSDNGELRVNIKEFLEHNFDLGMVEAFLPNKIILFRKEDLERIFLN